MPSRTHPRWLVSAQVRARARAPAAVTEGHRTKTRARCHCNVSPYNALFTLKIPAHHTTSEKVALFLGTSQQESRPAPQQGDSREGAGDTEALATD